MGSMRNNPLSLLNINSKVAILSHVSPDGDSLGSLIALGLAIKKLCDEVCIFRNDIFPGKYKFLPEYQQVEEYKEDQPQIFDFCFILDCGDAKRLGYSEVILNKSKKIINIDHHVSNTEFGDINLLDTNASSTCEMVYNLLKDFQLPLDKDIATCLYTGIATDTGNFVYDNTTAYTHQVVADLMGFHIDLHKISYHLYQNKPLSSVKLLAHVLNHMEICFDGKVAIITVEDELLKSFNISSNDVDGVINYARDIEGIEIAILLKENTNKEVKVGFRAKKDVDVSLLAGKFGGGGHKKASGAAIEGTIEEVRKKLEEQITIDLGW
ncbi:DHH family phosphoesterase [Clostridium aceticum]|nr:bifunctional oligoribonuclease/PAP phosphatase NrnA [Clostridium aceticum]